MKVLFLSLCALFIYIVCIFLISGIVHVLLVAVSIFPKEVVYCSEICSRYYYVNFVFLSYFGLLPLFLNGKTIGKILTKLEVKFTLHWGPKKLMIVTRSGLVASYYLLKMQFEEWSWFTGPGLFLTFIAFLFVLAIFNRRHRLIHDYLVHSVVVRSQ